MQSFLRNWAGKCILTAVVLLSVFSTSNTIFAQCSDTAAPSFSNSCANEYFQSIAITGSGVSSTVSTFGVRTCMGTFINDFAMQGTTAPGGSTVTLNIARPSHYAAYLSVFIDWNNDGTYETSELAGSTVTLASTDTGATYNFTVPASGADTGVHLHMRVMLSEAATGAPCSGSYGQAYEFFFIIGSGCTTPVVGLRPSTRDSVGHCPGGVGATIVASGAGAAGTYVWSPATGLSATTGFMVTANPDTTTIYTISGTSTGTCTATAYDTVVVFASGMPVDTLSYSGSTTICPNSFLVLTGTTGPGYRYQWLSTGAFVRSRSNTITVTAAGTYSLIINAYGCIDTSAPVTISTYPAPTPTITQVGTTLHTGSTYTSYQWYENGSPVIGATSDSVIATSAGTYNVLVTDSNGCSDTAFSNVLVNLAVKNINSLSPVAIYPNPATNVIHISAPVVVNAIVSGIDGKMMIDEKSATTINIAHLAEGVYILELFDEQGNRLAVQRLIKN